MMESNFYTTKNLYRNLIFIFSLVFFSFSFTGLNAQCTGTNVIFTEDFEDHGNTANGGAGRYTSTNDYHEGVMGSDDDYWGRIRASDQEYFLTNTASGFPIHSSTVYSGQNGDFYYAGEDLDDVGGGIGSPDGLDTKEISFTGININGATNMCFSGLFARGENDPCNLSTYDADDYIEVYYEIDGGGEVLAICFNPDLECNIPSDISNEPLHHDPNCDGDGGEGAVLTAVLTEYTFNIAGTGNSLNIRVEVHMDSGSEEVALDFLQVHSDTPVNASIVCPTVGAASASETAVCAADPFNITATGLATMDMASNMAQDFGIEFVAFTSTPADPYVGGTSLGTVAFGSLTGGGTTASLTGASLASAGSYEIYAILSPAPTDATCRPSAMTTITVNANPTVSFTAPADQCLNDPASAHAFLGSPTGGVYSGPGVTNNGDGLIFFFDPASAGVGVHTLTYTFTDGNGCTGSASDMIEVFALPTVTFTAPADLCVNDGVQAGLGGGTPTGGVYSGAGVTDGGNGMTYSFDPAAAGVGTHTLTYTFTDGSGCTNSASDDVEVFAIPTAAFTAPADLCINAGVQAGLGGGTPTGGVYSGPGVTDDGNGMTYSFDPAAAGVGTHTITYTVGVSGCSDSAMDDVEVFALPTVTMTIPAGEDEYCVNDATTAINLAGAPTGGVYSGTGVTDLGNGISFTFDPSTAGAGTHTVTYTFTDANGCTNSATDNIVVNPGPTVMVTSTNSICTANNGTASASATGGTAAYTYAWSNGDSGANISNLAPGTYTVTSTDANGCQGDATTTIGLTNTVLTVTATSTNSICTYNNGTASASASGGTAGYSYIWNNGAFGANISGLSPGTYIVTATDGNGCEGEASTVVGMDDTNPVVNFTAPADLCLDAGMQSGLGGGTPPQGTVSGDTGFYSGTGVTDDGNGMTYSFDPASAGVGTHTLSYTYTDQFGCTNTAMDDIEVFALPTVTFTAPADLCITAGVQTGLGIGTPTGGIYSGPGVTDDGNGMTYSFDPAAAGAGTHTLTYTFTDPNGCSGSASDDIEVFTTVSATFTALADLCENDGVQTGLGGGMPAAGVGETGVYSGTGVTDDGNNMTYSFDPAAAGVGTHTITYTFTTAAGCMGTGMDDVEVFAAPVVTFTALADLSITAGVQAGLGGGTPTGGVYSGPGVTDDGNGMTYSFDPVAAGPGVHTLTYTVTDANGCTGSASDDVEVFEIIPSISQTDEDGDGIPDILDPCDCGDPMNMPVNGMLYFHDFIVVNSNPGEMWEVTAITSGAMHELPIPSPLTAPVALMDIGPGALPGSRIYRIDFWTLSGEGFAAEVNRVGNPLPMPLTTGGTCADIDPPVFTSMCPPSITIECSDPIPTAPVLMATDVCGFPGTAAAPDVVFINEFHYDNTGGDVGEFVEVAGTAGIDLTGYSIVLYNGNGGAAYNTVPLSMTIDDEGMGAGAISFLISGIQNGAPDGLALVDPMGMVIEFLSYEGAFTATAGPANGMMSTNVGVSEPGSTPVGESLQLTGAYPTLSWSGPSAESPGDLNAMEMINFSGSALTNGPIDIMAVDNFVAGTCANTGVLTRTWTATDAAGNPTVCTQTITIEDNIAPSFVESPLPADVTVECDAIPTAATLSAVDNCVSGMTFWINEFHYDNAGGDVGEFIEIAGVAGTDLSGYSFELYNGANGNTYNTISLSGIIPDEGMGYGAIDFQLPVNGLQNGAPDGFALIAPGGVVLEFLSYEGTIMANNGSAVGTTSTNVGVSETSGTAIGQSLQLTGMGTMSADFAWSGPSAESPGTLNAGQTIAGDLPVVFAENTVAGVCSGESTITRTWTATDDCGNPVTHTQVITVEDNSGPTALCQNLSIDLDADGNATITPDQIDNGSSDNCGPVTLSLSQTDFTCGDIGDNTVTLTVTDDCGNSSTCTATVTVADNLPPVLTCPGDQTIHLDPGACEQYLYYDVSAVDNCEGMLTTTFLGTTFLDNNGFAGNMFDVSNIGSDELMITSFDVHLETGLGTNHTVAAYYVLGGYAGNETNAGAWTLMGDVPVISAGPGNPSPMPAGGLTIQPGEVYGIYIFQTDGGSNIDYTNGANTYSDANMQIDAGLGRGTPIWTGGIFNPRTWNGNVHYSIVTGAPPVVQQTAGLPSGSAFPIGTTTNTWTATDNYGNTSTCTWSVTVVEYVPASNDITCNSLVHISLDENCEAIVGADQILEGNNYGCYDNYIVTFVDTGLPVILDGSHVGNTYEVMVTNPNGNPCWGYILVEDKLIPDLVCNDDITVRCDDGTDPGSSYVATSDMVAPTMSVDNATVSETVTFGGSNGSVVDVDVTVESDHTWVGDLIISITSPGGTTVELMNNIGGPGFGCAGDGLDLVFDDAATMTYADLDGTCNNNPAAEGTFQPLEALSVFNGQAAAGDWTISVTDLAGGDSGDVNVTINLSANSVIPFPVPATATVTPTADPYTFNVSNFDPCGNTILTYSDVESGDLCVGNAQIVRTWTATDESGNTTSCTENITIVPTTIADVLADLPSDITIECGETIPPVLSTIGCDNIGVALNGPELTIDICEGSYKILRNYIIVDWCDNSTTEHLQIIKVLDTEGPTLACPADLTISTSSNDCEGGVILAWPTASDCGTASGNIGLVPSSTAGDLSYNAGQDVWTIDNLPVGVHTVTWTATDDCGNESTCDVDITVEDQIAPIAICDEITTVSVGTDGTALIYAETFDDGSHDNCGIVEMEARRMDNPACPGFDGTLYGPSVPFSCCDVNTTVMVEFRVKDAAGNVNVCMVEVYVEDKIAPTVICPADANLQCSETYLDYIVQGQPLPQAAIDANGSAIADDNCGIETFQNVVTQNNVDCGEGTIEIAWSAVDIHGNPFSCIQRYFVTNDDPFNIEDTEHRNYYPLDVLGSNGEFHTLSDDVEWPVDYEGITCGNGLEPSDLSSPYNYPIIYEGACDNIAVGHHDQVLDFGVGDACLKILRKWYVIDWCQAGDNQDPTQPGPGVWHYTQVIKVINSNDPTVTVVDFPAVIDNYDADCGNAAAAFEITVDDDCTAQADIDVTWEFSTGLTGSGLSASGAFANGSYSLSYTVSDGCGNTVWEIHDFDVVDAKKPTPVCIFGIATTVMPSSGAVTIWASDFESGSSYDNCTAYDDLHFSFSQDINDTHMDITCAMIENDPLVPVTLYVTDATGNFDFCSTFINVQDPNGVCVIPTGLITGTIENETQELIEEVEVNLTDANGSIPNVNPVVTGADGYYQFSNMGSGDYDVTPGKDINYLNGVTTYDLVLIAKHILGIELLDSPYKMVAADANNTQSITTLDIVKLRALILHIDDELADNSSWRFVDADFVFGTNVFDFPEHIDINTASNFDPANFVAMKIGDVNGTASPNSLLGSDTRTFDGNLILSLETLEVTEGETFTIDFRANEFKNIEGYQFTLGFDNSAVEFVEMSSNLEGLGSKNFGLTKLDEGVITTSWNSSNGVTVANDEVLFSITFIANEAVNTSELLSINSRYTAAEAYSNSDLYNVLLEFNGKTVSNGFELYQNTPNPFKSETTIGFNMPQAGAVTLKIYDVSGRVLRLIEMEAVKGANSVNVTREGMDATGVLYYQLETATETATKKMILVD